MIRLLLHSHDTHLQNLLASAPGRDFSLAVESSRERVRELVLNKKCDVVILDLEFCPLDERFGFFDELRDLDVQVAILTDNDSRERAVELGRRGVRQFCRKPLSVQELSIVAQRAREDGISKCPAVESPPPSTAPSGCGQLVGSSAGSQLVYDLIRRVASLDAFVLITGESGTGKELIARAIHSLGNRDGKPFVAVSCGAIPESLIEAELFGYEKGAFTGAAARRTGFFEEAGDGTLLLDEIGEISHHTQVKLLRVLQQKEFTRLGSARAIPLRARVLFATNRDLKQMVAAGTFREDLYYRLNVVGIRSQPLRDRPDEIPQLAHHFLARYARSFRKNTRHIEPRAMALLSEYGWPGNIRELENAIQAAIVLSDDDSIRVSNLPEEMRQSDLKRLNDALQWSSFEDRLRDYKVKLAIDAVKECNGNKTLAAQSLNISRTYLHRLIREPEEDRQTLRVA